MHRHYRRAQFLTNILDQQFSVFGYRFGLDPILGLIIGSGDLITLIIGSYYVWIAHKLHATPGDIARMVVNIALDVIIGFIPILGDIFDFSFKAHLKNMQILERYKSNLDYLEGTLD